MMQMLDTDISSYVIKKHPPEIAARLREIPSSLLCISVITRAELLYGLKRLAPEHTLHTGVRQFLKIIHILPWDQDAADFYADIRYQLVSTGQTIGEMDMMIAAHALSAGAVLVTNNTRHFARIAAPLRMVNWLHP
jgi:tRNA(fMet)-specific endonuclease VapC